MVASNVIEKTKRIQVFIVHHSTRMGPGMGANTVSRYARDTPKVVLEVGGNLRTGRVSPQSEVTLSDDDNPAIHPVAALRLKAIDIDS